VTVPGTLEQDKALMEFILTTANVGEAWLKPGKMGKKAEHFAAHGEYSTYRTATQNCNDFADHALDVHTGKNWHKGLITTGGDLVETWKSKHK
jgi:hypothetical protein